jgi:hypothetical protein
MAESTVRAPTCSYIEEQTFVAKWGLKVAPHLGIVKVFAKDPSKCSLPLPTSTPTLIPPWSSGDLSSRFF